MYSSLHWPGSELNRIYALSKLGSRALKKSPKRRRTSENLLGPPSPSLHKYSERKAGTTADRVHGHRVVSEDFAGAENSGRLKIWIKVTQLRKHLDLVQTRSQHSLHSSLTSLCSDVAFHLYVIFVLLVNAYLKM